MISIWKHSAKKQKSKSRNNPACRCVIKSRSIEACVCHADMRPSITKTSMCMHLQHCFCTVYARWHLCDNDVVVEYSDSGVELQTLD